MSVYFTSDPHLGHRAMAWFRKTGHWPTEQERPLVTPEIVAAHDAMLADAWDSTVRKDDIVWVLGDLTANIKSIPHAIDWFNDRPGIKHLVLGNHDAAHPMHSESYKWEDRYREAFKSVGTMRRRRIAGKEVMLSHFPYDGDGAKEDRGDQYRLRNKGIPVLHGHVHSKDQVTVSSQGSTQIHVGVDAWDYKPVSLDTIADLLSV